MKYYLEPEQEHHFIPASISNLYNLFLFFHKKNGAWEFYAVFLGEKRQVKIDLQDLSNIDDVSLRLFLINYAIPLQSFMNDTMPFNLLLGTIIIKPRPLQPGFLSK